MSFKSLDFPQAAANCLRPAFNFFATPIREAEEICRDLATVAANVVLDTGPYPFGKDNYDARNLVDSQHLDPARLEWVRNKIAELENVPEEPTGRDQELEDMRAINIALQAEIDDLKKYDVRQILVDTVPGLDDLNAAQVYALNAAQVAEILSSRSLENVELKGEVSIKDVRLSVGGYECQVQCGDVYEVRRADLPDHHLDPKPDETPYV